MSSHPQYPQYLLENSSPLANMRFHHLETLYDQRSKYIVSPHLKPGMEVWLPGAGSGSLAPWITSITKANVHVTDLDIRWFAHPGKNILQYRHDMTTEDFPTADLIHARLILQHLPNWKQHLRSLYNVLPPGGILVVEELDPCTPYDPTSRRHSIQNIVGDSFTRLLGHHGADYSNGRSMVQTLQDAGFTPLSSSGYQVVGMNQNAAVQLMKVNAQQTRKELVEICGLTDEQIDEYLRVLDEPGTWFHMPIMYSTVVQKGAI